MLVEAVAGALVGMAGLWLVLRPLFQSTPGAPLPVEPLDPEETPKGIALTALKEIEFDRETGKLSQADYEFLKTKYTAAAVEALRSEQAEPSGAAVEEMIAAKVRRLRGAFSTSAPHCTTCGPRPEVDAIFCSTCGLRLVPASIPTAVAAAQ
jgi:hypothetical protein